jgi:hypothetical protein
MARRSGYMVAATAVWAMKWVRIAVTTKDPRRIALVLSPTTISIRKARRRVRPVLVKTAPTTREAKMNMTDGSMKSLKAVLAGRIRKKA